MKADDRGTVAPTGRGDTGEKELQQPHSGTNDANSKVGRDLACLERSRMGARRGWNSHPCFRHRGRLPESPARVSCR